MRPVRYSGHRLILPLLLLLTVLLSVPVLHSSVAHAAQPASQLAQASTPAPGNAQTDNAAGGQVSAPSPVSSQAAGGGAQAVPTGGPSPLPTGNSAVNPGAGVTDNPTSSGGDFPWAIVAVIVLLLIAGLGFAAMRQRRPATVPIEEPVTPARRRGDLAHLTRPQSPQGAPGTSGTQQQAATDSTGAPAPVATPRPYAPSAAMMPATVVCPNCGATNSTNEKFCHECGEDLRAAIASLAPPAASVTTVAPQAPVAPPVAPAAAPAAMAAAGEEVDADTPYLETLDRVDEQLEFVLSRPVVAIGTAQGNDIVVDAGFKGWQSVSPKHAELRHEQDGFLVVDLESESGTFVNELRTGENILANGDLVRLGDVRFIFHIPADGE